MEQLDLFRSIKRFGSAKLSRLVGLERLEAIDEILAVGVTEGRLVNLLKKRYGTQLFAQKEIRLAIFSFLPGAYQGYILDGVFEPLRGLTSEEKRQLLSLNWGRKIASSQRVLDIFGLDDHYLPPRPPQIPSHEVIDPTIQLFPYQLRVKDKLVRLLHSEVERILLHMPTGAGKTRTCVEGAIDFWRSYADRSGFLVWLAHSEELCEQAVETIHKLWKQHGDTTLGIFRLWGSHETPQFNGDGGWVVASLQRLHAMRIGREDAVFRAISKLKSKCQMIIVDEAHKSIAPTYRSSIDFISNPGQTKIIGLTATPGRGIDSQENLELASFFHRNKITISHEDGSEIDDPILYLQNKGYLAKIARREIKTNVTIDLNEKELKFAEIFLDIPSSVLKRLAGDAERNALILAEIAALHSDGRNIIVFSLSVDHAHLITELLLLRGIEARCIDGGTSQYDRITAIDDYKAGNIRVLVNYGVLTTGFDAPNTNAVVITRPTGSIVLYAQMIGRGIRGQVVGGNPECILIDLKDNLVGFPDERQAFSYFDECWT